MQTPERITVGTARKAASQTERRYHYGVNRQRRITAPSGAVILF